MRKLAVLCFVFAATSAFAQEDSSVTKLMASMDELPVATKPVTKIFYGQKLINANTVELGGAY